MANNYFVSVIIPVYNVEGYLNSCLDSVINQSYHNLEIVLVDDGSKDNSGTICDEYAQKDKRIIVIHKKNEGVAQARIDGFNRSSGELVTFIDSDDYVDLNYIEKLVSPFEQNEIDLSICNNSNVTKGIITHKDRPVQGLLAGDQIKKMISSRYLFDSSMCYAGMPIFLVTKLSLPARRARRPQCSASRAGSKIWIWSLVGRGSGCFISHCNKRQGNVCIIRTSILLCKA